MDDSLLLMRIHQLDQEDDKMAPQDDDLIKVGTEDHEQLMLEPECRR